jgi:uncharacterized protein YndB with AHSA1/START domain
MNAVAAPAVVTVSRVIAASPEALFAAWLDPASLSQWLRPFATTHTDATVDARVGGAFALDMHTPDGVVAHRGEYVAIEPHTRLVFTWDSPHTAGASLVTVTFTPRGEGTKVQVLHEKLPADKLQAHTGGWTSGLEKLDAFAAAGDAS